MITQIVEENKEIKYHMSKLTNVLAVGEHEKFPAQAQPNPRGQHMTQTSGSGETNLKEVNAITTRSGKVIEPIPKLRKSEKDPSSIEESTPSEETVKNSYRVPFPQALKSTSKSSSQYNEILEHLKQVKVNLHLLHVIFQVPTYAKVFKDLCTVKRKHHVKKIVFFTEHVSVVVEQKILPNYKDPGCPTVSCIIGNHKIAQALLDLGASVNIMSYAIYSALGRDVNVNSKIPIILGRPFFATTNALINCRNGLIKLSFGNMTLDVNIFHIIKQPEEDDDCHQTYRIDTLVEEEAHALIDPNPLNSFFLNSEIPARDDIGEYVDIDAAFNDL
ncbi:uncharacterized protein LOC111377926 [Olea europaea var. sylvestris]|uniref:uncharacterized protein LOC111377926 n=1 Tax=Olea europaea var. sylvestris TaxID=158386 RepID=UPI000C1D5195|nr:uncharacterized protein LOC111377926 [Olea europaea var. sylvestris]